MKTFLSIVIFLGCTTQGLFAQICEYQGTSTNPNSANSPTAPSSNPEHWLNSFNWFDNDGTSLLNFFMYDMFSYSPNQTSMSNPYSDVNSLYTHLSNQPLELKDFRPENGWELISVNLGAFPNGELLSEHPPLQSNFSQTPYLLLYNRNRGLLRLFGNSLTGLDNGFDHIVIRLYFADDNEEVSGLLRHYNGLDQALDQNTLITTISSVVKHPNNSQHWFQADFQLGYDPCTCLFRSNLKIEFQFVNSLEINMVSNSISTEVALVNSDGSTNIPDDFLSGVNYQDGFEDAGMLIYSTHEKLIDGYLARLEFVENYNAGIGADVEKIKRKKWILKALKFALNHGVQATIPNDLATNLSTYANHLLKEWNLDGLGTVKLKTEELEKEAKKLLGKGMDWLSTEWIGTEQEELPAPTVPTAVIATSTFNGSIDDVTVTSGPTLMNPGTYPIGAAGNEINPHNFPVYNEILGLFALLESPQIKMAHHIESEVLEETIDWGADPLTKYRKYEVSNNFKFILDKPLKYAFNPAAGIDLANVDIQASIEAQFTVVGHPYSDWSSNQVYVPPFQYCWQKKRFPNESSHMVQLDNLDLDYISENPTSIPITEDFDVLASSRMISLENFNTLVGEISVVNIEKWGLRRCANTNPSTWDQAWNTLIADAEIELEEVQFFLKIMVTMPFEQQGYNGENLQTVQYFTYLLDSENGLILVDFSDPELTTTWSFNANQNNGSMPTQEILELGEKTWTAADYVDYGGADPQHIQVYATDRILITGNQTIDPSILSVEFIATNEIVVQNESLLNGNFHLYLDDFIEMASLPTSQVSSSYLESFCSGQAPNSYQANVSSRAHEAGPVEPTPTPEQKPQSFQAKIYPSLIQSAVDVTVETTDPIRSILIYNAIGVLIYSAYFEEQANTIQHKINATDFANGMYTVLLNDVHGNTVNKKLIIRK
jgi:hypothetical protein